MREASYTAIHLQFGGGLHLSRRSDDLGQSRALPTSDSLKAALTACHAQLLGPARTEEQIIAFMDSFRLSNAFPLGAGGAMHLPVPLGQWPLPGLSSADPSWKTLRKQRYIPWEAFADVYLRGHSSTQDIQPQPKQLRQLVQRVQVAKPWEGQGDAFPYMVEELRWTPDTGLWCLLDCTDAGAARMVMAAWRLLGDQGMGQGKTLGGGRFTASAIPLTLPQDETGHWMALGNHLPILDADGRMPDSPVAWTLEQVGGFMAGASALHHRRMSRRSIPMLGEGSIFQQPAAPQGRWIDLAPAPDSGCMASHPVYRDGRCIFLPIHIHQPIARHERLD